MEWNKLDGCKALVDSGLASIPDFYIKPLEERPSHRDPDEEQQLPIIDVSRLLDPASPPCDDVIAAIVDASEKWGFFQVVGHGIDSDLAQRMLAVAHEFFQQPLEDKMAYYGTDIHAPVRYGTSFNPSKEECLNWQDNLLHRFLPEQGDAPHPWPEKPVSYRETSEEYMDKVKFLAKKLLRALSKGLGLDATHLEKEFGKHQIAFRLNYYPPCPRPDLVMGVSSHSDIGGFAILLQDNDVVGLQAKLQGEWRTIKPVTGALVVNIADQLQIFSNGKLKSVEHRAILNESKARVSVPLFYDPSPDVRVAPIPELLDPEHPAAYKSCVYREYFKIHFSKELVGKELVDSRKIST